MNKFVKGEQRVFIEDLGTDLLLVHILDPDPHPLDHAVKPILAVLHHSTPGFRTFRSHCT